MTAVEGATCRNCGREVDSRPCQFCGGNVMDFRRGIIEPHVGTTDNVTRTAQGIRERKNKWAIFMLLVISGFDAFVILSNANMTNLTIHLFISIAIFISGYFTFTRSQNLLLITMRRLFRETEPVQNVNANRRRCNRCNAEFEEKSCPECGASDSRIIIVNNEAMDIDESVRLAKRNNFTKINRVGMIFLILLAVVQGYFTYSNGGIINLVNSSLMALILFIPSYYAFLRVYFTDTETFH